MTLSLLQHLYRPHHWNGNHTRASVLKGLRSSRVPGIFHPHLVAGIEKHSWQEVQRLLRARCHDDLFSRTTYSAGVAHIFRDGSSQRWITTSITLPIQRSRCFAINARRNARPQFDWKQVDCRLVAPKRLTDGMRSWLEKCGLKKTLRALCYSRSGNYLPGGSLFSRRGHLPPWRRYDKCSSTHFGRNESLSLKLLECCHDCTPGKAVLCCQVSRGRQSCSRFQSAINNCGAQLSIEPAPDLLASPSSVLRPGLEMSLLSALLYTPAHGLVMLTIMDLLATPFQSSDLVKGEYVMKMRSTQGGDR